MKNNRLNNNRITMIAKNLPSSLLDLDFSNNTIGNDGISSICDFLSSKKCYLQILNLEDNKLRDGPVITILKTLQ
jgi:Ran GTPase-activating protein (RanGAP) involved in mRNA processing and transport